MVASHPFPNDALATPPTAAATATVLVVDDDPGIRYLLAAVLAAEGFQVVTAEDGIDALQVVTAVTPAVCSPT